MRHALEFSPGTRSPFIAFFDRSDAKEQFQQRFRCALLQCMRRGFQVEECFGVIWEETLEEVELTFREQNEIFPDMIDWAKRWMQPV
jgi:hypothetical protein